MNATPLEVACALGRLKGGHDLTREQSRIVNQLMNTHTNDHKAGKDEVSLQLNKLSEMRREIFITVYNKTKSVREVAETIGIDRTSAFRWAKKFGVPVRRRCAAAALLLLGALSCFGQFNFADPAWICQTPPSSGGTYTANAATYDGSNDYLTRSTALTGAADSKVLLISIWFKRAADGTEQFLLRETVSSASRFEVKTSNTDLMTLNFRNASGTTIANIASFRDYTGNTSWQHLLISFNLANASERAIYTNGVAWSGTWNTYTDDTIDMTPDNWWIGSGGAGSLLFNGCLAEVYVNPFESSWFDITVQANREKFIKDGKPVNLGSDGSTPTGNVPLIYLKSASSSWEVNSSGRGDFTKTGSFDSCTSP